VIVAVHLFAEVAVFEGVFPSGVVSLPMSVELVKLVGHVGFGAEERCEELLEVLIIHGKNRVGREWSDGDVDDSQVGG